MAPQPYVSNFPELVYTSRADGFRWVHTDKLCGGWADDAALLPFLKKLPAPRRYLTRVAPQQGWARLLLAYGKPMRPSPYQSTRKQTPGQCYNNSLAMRRGVLHGGQDLFHYAEGIAITPNGPELHGWNMIAGHVFDSTWHCPHSVKYFGITFGDDFLRWLWFATRRPTGILMRLPQTATYIENYCLAQGKGGLRT